jgi:HK97 family phage major capsid protein/HK97 family phage prohead protease
MLQRAYALLEIKGMSDEDKPGKRTFSGIATTPSPDRMGDIVEPKGAQFKLPIPLLWQHDSRQPIGWVTSAKVTSAGIEIEGEVADIPEEGALKERLATAWQSIKNKLVRGLSIGFSAIEHAQIDGTWGVRFVKWEWLELSAVTIPANGDASITAIKSIDTRTRAALGLTRKGVVRLDDPPGASGITKAQPASSGLSSVPKGNTVKTIAEQISAFEAKRTSAMTRMSEIMAKAGETGETLDEASSQEYDTLADECKTIDGHITRLKAHEAFMVSKGTPVQAQSVQTAEGASSVRGGAIISVKSNLPKGTEFARYAKCLAAAHGSRSEALEIAKTHYPDMPRLHTVLKAAVAAGTTTDSTWAGALVDYQHFSGDFVEYLRPMTIIGKFGQNGIPELRRVPFNIQVPTQTSGGSGYWVGQGQPKPLTKFDFDNILLTWAKVANIAVLTDELVRFSNPAADVLVRNALAEALQARLDTDFVDPTKAVSANVSPASITNGLSPITSSGNDADAIRVDVAAVMAPFIAANLTPTNGVWIMAATTALRLSLMRNSLGQKEFPDVTMLGGYFEGLPVIVSQYVHNSTSGGAMVILANASDIYLSDDGGVTIDASREASLQMLDNPTNASSDGTATTMVSMFQTNSIAIRAERMINWKKRRSAAVAYLDSVHWGE